MEPNFSRICLYFHISGCCDYFVYYNIPFQYIYSCTQRQFSQHHTHPNVLVLQHHLELFILLSFSLPAYILYLDINHHESDHIMSQHPLCTQLGCLPLAKFSHTTTSINHKGPFTWSHIPGDGNMIGIFERIFTSSSTATRLLLRIAHNNHVLVCLYHLLATAP